MHTTMSGIVYNSYNPILGMLMSWKTLLQTNPGGVLWNPVEREDRAEEREGTTPLSSLGSWATSHAQTSFSAG